MKNKTILISGASIAGPALAYWLGKYGYNTTIIERAQALRPGGYAVDFRGTAMEVLRRMDLLDEVKKFETRAGKIGIVNRDNKKIGSFPDGFTSGELEIMRGDLARVLYEATRENTEYIFDDTITGLQQTNDGVYVTFSNSKSRKFDLVIGADGQHSRVRSLAFGPEENYLHHLGLYIAIFTTPNFMHLGMDGVYYGTLGKRAGLFGADHGREARASFYFASDALKYDYRDTFAQKKLVRERFKAEGWQVPRLLQYMDLAPDFYFDSISQIRMNSWHDNRIALVGDAAYCASPMSGMGTSMAIIGAYILAGELRAANGDYPAAFRRYEEQMRPFVTRCQGLADGVDWFVPKTRFKQWLSRQFWKVLPYTPWKNMMIEMPMKIANSIRIKTYDLPTASHFYPSNLP